MGVSDHYAGSMTERLIVSIITVDPSTNRIEVVGKDAAVIQVGIGPVPPLFRWPKQGEYWVIERVNGQWQLDSLVEDPDSLRTADIQPGEVMVQADKIWTSTGEGVVTHPDMSGSQGLLWNGTGWTATDLFTQSEADAFAIGVGAIDNRVGVLEATQPSFTTSLPLSPVDGQEIYYQSAALATLGIVWHFRYRAASGSAFKWEAVGSQVPLTAVGNTTSGTIASTTYAAPVTVGSISLTLPLAGDYDIECQAHIWNQTAGLFNSFYSYVIGATAASDNWAAISGIGNLNASVTKKTRQAGVAAGASVSDRARIDSGTTATLDKRRLFAMPVRVG